jgi:hypothetical protein
MKPSLEKLELAVKNHMNEASNPSIINLREGILWMDRILNYTCGVADLDGINDTLLYAIEELYGGGSEQRKSLTIVATETESYLEKLVFLIKGIDYTGNKSMTLINMIDELNLSSVIKNRNINASDFFTEERILGSIGEPEFLEHICRTYKKRNDIVHNSPSYDIADIYLIARSLLITMLYATIKHLDKIKEVINANLSQIKENGNLSLIDDKTEVFYNFISHGKANREIKEQLIETFVLHKALKMPGISIANLTLECNDFFNTSFGESSFERRLTKLVETGKLHLKDGAIILTEEEKQSLNDEIDYFSFQEQLFKQNISEILKRYYAVEETDKVYFEFNKMIENNYQVDLSEIFNKLVDSNMVSASIQEFRSCIESILKSRGQYSEENVLDVVIELLSICYSNDFLHKKCSIVFYGSLNNQSGLENYFRQMEREVYLDTNVLLFVFCRYYYDAPSANIPEYNVVRELLLLCERNKSIKLKVYREYVLELAYQVRSALLLIPFEEVGFFKDGYSSSNIFFKYYFFLKENDLLEYEVETFKDFIEGFDVYYNDLFEYRPLDKIAEVCQSILKSEGIEVVFFDEYETTKLFQKFESISNSKRGARTISNDVQMIAYLSDQINHELDPYFITYDSLFIKMRQFTLDEIKRVQFWHVYFPSRFIAHINMLNFKVDAKSFTDDFISILSKTNFTDDTSMLADVMSDFMDIRSDSKRLLIKKLQEFNIKYLSEFYPADIDQEQRSDFNPVGELLKEISYHYKDVKIKISLLDIKKLILSPEKTNEISNIFDEALNYYSKERKFSPNLFSQLEALL